MALFATCSSASAADLFFIVGQAATRWHSPTTHAQTTADVKLLSWGVGSKFTSILGQACKKEDCPDFEPVDGVAQAFAHTWTGFTKRPAHFLLYRKPDVAMTKSGADGKGYWTDFETPRGVYQDALSEFRKAQQSVTLNGSASINRRYLIWIQSETDSRAGVSAADYEAKLIELFDRFNKDLGAERKFDAMFIVSSGLLRETAIDVNGQISSTPATVTPETLNAIIQAQDRAAAQGKVVMLSRSMRRTQVDCASGQGRSGCDKDRLRYQTWLYETLGKEMARNAFIYHSKGIKPLLPENCKQESASCAGTADVYRWVAKSDVLRRPVYGTDPYEFDEKTYYVSRTRIALFQDDAPGRIALYRTSEQSASGISTEAGSSKTKALGYCYSVPMGNANAKLMVMQQDGITSLARLSTEASQVEPLSPDRDKTLCFIN